MTTPLPTGTLGTSLALAGGDLVLRAGDLATVSGTDNLLQGLQVLVGTPWGSDPVNVGYGLDAVAIFAVDASAAAIKDIVRLNLVKSLSRDNRIREIRDIVFDDEAGFAALARDAGGADPGAAARHGRAWHALVSFETIAGERGSLAVGGPAA